MKRPLPLAFLLTVGLMFAATDVTFAQAAGIAEEPAAKNAAIYDVSVPGVGPIRNEPWFVKTWKDRRAHFAEEKAKQQHAIVFFGDSITQGWSDDFRGKFPGLNVANRGISGDTSRGLLARVDEDVLALDPSAIVLLIGTNDIGLKVQPEDIVGNIKLLLEKIAAHNSNTPIILCEVMPTSGVKQHRPVDQVRKLNGLLTDMVRGNKQVTVLDTYTLFAGPDGDATLAEFPDLLHPNDIGYSKWKAGLWPLLATLGLVEKEADTFTPEPGFEALFDGRDLDGWGFRKTSDAALASIKKWRAGDKKMPAYPIVEAPVSFDGKTESNDGRYRAINGRLVVTTPSEGRRIQELATTGDIPGDFTLKLDFRATPNADSGVFIRGHQLQCRDYSLAGPDNYKKLKGYKPQDWNELVIEVKGDKAHCTCNGEVLEAAYDVPTTGPIGLEGDRGQMEYRHIRIHKN